MINFLHTFTPDSILISFGSIVIYWYGLFIVMGILTAILVAMKLAEYYNIKKEMVIDAVFWLIITGIIGARIYHVFLELPFYLENPVNIIKIWEGGLAIHGAIITGIITLYYFTKKYNLNFWILTSLFVPGLALAQAFGRWGNYFNQELFGKPTNLPWGIPIATENRIMEYFNSSYFHPTFIYESIGSLIIFGLLIYLHILIIKKGKLTSRTLVLIYLIAYSLLRFILEFVRIDKTPEFLLLRWPQIASLVIIIIAIILLKKQKNTNILAKKA